MKEHAKKALKHDFEVAGKTIPTLAIAALFLVGTGSAALLSSFGTVSGEADVQQAVTFSGGDTVKAASFNDTAVTAGTTSSTKFTLENDADRSATVTLDSGASEIEGISQVVKMESYDQQTFIADPVDTSKTSQIEVVVQPREQEVEYTLELPDEYNGGDIDLELSRSNGDNFHVKFRHTTDTFSNKEFGYKDPSSSGSLKTWDSSSELASNFGEVVSADASDSDEDGQADEVNYVIERESGYEQTFGVNAYSTSSGGTNWDTQGFDWSDSGTDNHITSVDYQTRNFDNPVTVTTADMATDSESNTQVTLPADSNVEFKVTTDFHVALDPQPGESEPSTDDGDYLVDLEVAVPSSTTP